MEGNKRDSTGIVLSRRDFLRLAGVVVSAGALGGLGLGELIKDREFGSNVEPLKLTPEIVDGVEVYGLNEKITSSEMVDGFNNFLTDEYERLHGVHISDKIRQARELLDPHERYLEVAVRRTAYESFLRKQNETGVSFPMWIKIHLDVLNQCIRKARPDAEIKAVLRRIIVVEDEATTDYWDEAEYRNNNIQGSALDFAWYNRYWPFTFDTDESWAVADDYRGRGGKPMMVMNLDGKTVIETPSGERFEYPEAIDSLPGTSSVEIDMGLVHEWSHYLLNLPDEYGQDVHDGLARFTSFTIGTGSFGNRPDMSPHLASLLTYSVEKRVRDYRTDRLIFDYVNIRPEEVVVNVSFKDEMLPAENVEVRRVRLIEGSFYLEKSVPVDLDQKSDSNSITFNNRLFHGNSNCWLLKTAIGGTTREIFLPVAALNMSKIAGLDAVRYDLIFSGYDDSGKAWQEVMYVDDTNIDQYLLESRDPYYAKMKIEGTSTWFVWFLRS